MSTELIIAIAITVGVNVIGWGGTIWRISNSASKEAGRMEEKIDNLDEKVGNIPCVKDPEYFKKTGIYQQKVDNLEGRVGRMESKINGR